MSTSTMRYAPVAMEPETFSALGHELVDQIAALLAAVPDRPITANDSPSGVRDALNLNGPLPEEGADPATLLAETARQLFEHSLLNAHPRFFGYITAPPAPIGILGDFLASALNANVGSWTLVAGRDGNRIADRAMDRGADWVSRRAAVCLSAAARWRTSCA